MADGQPNNEQATEATALPFDRYQMVVMNRKELASAPYNPRIITDEEKKRLRAGLKEHGMLQPPVWNKRTGNLVGGHQRISQLDVLHGSPDYMLQVAVVDMDLAQEKAANILLNNPSAMGDWDLEKLDEILKDQAVNLLGTGFDMADVYRLFGDMPGAGAEDRSAGVDELAQKLRGFQERYTAVSDNFGRDYFYLVVVFRDYATRNEFLTRLKLEENRYQDGRRLMDLLQPATAMDSQVVNS